MSASIQSNQLKHWALYLVKAAALFGVLGLFCWKAGELPGIVVALAWALLTATSTLGLMYYAVVRKTKRQLELRTGGRLARINQGRAVRLVVYFIISAICSAGFILETARWDVAHLYLAGAGIVLFVLVYFLVNRLLRSEFKPVVHTAYVIGITTAVTGALLCIVYIVALFLFPEPTYYTAAGAFLAARQSFAGSPSALLGEVGTLASFTDGLTIYALSTASGFSKFLYLFLSAVFLGGTFFTLVNLLGVCSLQSNELMRIFRPLEAISEQGPVRDSTSESLPEKQAPATNTLYKRPIRKYVAIFASLPVVLLVAFVVADIRVSQACEGVEVTPAMAFVSKEMNLATYFFDGHSYDKQAVDTLVEQTAEKAASLSEGAQENIATLVNKIYDTRLANVDSYLDWYYSLTGDYEQLFSLVTGTAEEFAEQKFNEHIDAGVDTSKLASILATYCTNAGKLVKNTAERFANCELTDIPSWLLTETEPLDVDLFVSPLAPATELLSFGERLGISVVSGGVAGVATGVVTGKAIEKVTAKAGKEVVGETAEKATKTLVSKVTGKQFFKGLVKKISSTLGSKAIGSAVGGVVGTLGGPAGVAVGAAAGAAISVGVDAALVQVDEWLNRDSYREEIVSAIEEDRDEWLALNTMLE